MNGCLTGIVGISIGVMSESGPVGVTMIVSGMHNADKSVSMGPHSFRQRTLAVQPCCLRLHRTAGQVIEVWTCQEMQSHELGAAGDCSDLLQVQHGTRHGGCDIPAARTAPVMAASVTSTAKAVIAAPAPTAKAAMAAALPAC